MNPKITYLNEIARHGHFSCCSVQDNAKTKVKYCGHDTVALADYTVFHMRYTSATHGCTVSVLQD